jgi:hypothetical protein
MTKTTKQNTFDVLSAINVNDKTEKKGNLTYLSWSWAWAEVKKLYPDATYTYYRNTETNLPYSFQEGMGAFCHTSVTIQGETLEMWLPVMDNRNQAVKEPSSTQINTTLMRCLTKNLAMHGLGLYIYAGEDLPHMSEAEIIESSKSVNKKKEPIQDWEDIVTKAKAMREKKQAWSIIVTKLLEKYDVDTNQLSELKKRLYGG